VTRAVCLSALVAISGDGSIEPVVGAGNAALAIISARKWGCRKHQEGSQRGCSKRFPEE